MSELALLPPSRRAANWRGEKQDQVDAQRRGQALLMAAARNARLEARGAGLVSVSTSHADESIITIDPLQTRLSRLRKAVGVSAKALQNLSGHSKNVCMVTLTYAGDNDAWSPKHISTYLNRVRDWHSRQGGGKLRYVWVAELQKRGVIHYHVVFWLKKGLTMPKADKRGWWLHGWTNTMKARKPVAYIMKYASKADSKNGVFPHGARIHGVGGLDDMGRACKRWVLWPAYVQANASVSDRFKPAQGGGYRNDSTGELLLSEFAPSGGGFRSFVRVRTNPRFDFGNGAGAPAGPFSWLTNSADAGAAGYLH